MKILGRILLFILVLALLAGLVMVFSTFVALPWVTDFTRMAMQDFFWVPMALSIVLLFFIALSVLGLILIVSVPTKRKVYVVKRNAGNIEITKQSIESAIGGTLESNPDVKRYQVRVKGNPKPNKLKLKLRVEPRTTGVHLRELGTNVQQQVKNDLAQCLSVDPKNIRIRIQPVQYQQQEGRHHARVPRVV